MMRKAYKLIVVCVLCIILATIIGLIIEHFKQ